MSRLDDIERRLAALESGGGDGMAPRIKALEECLGLTNGGVSAPECPVIHCGRCNEDQKVGAIRCPQTKCPLK